MYCVFDARMFAGTDLSESNKRKSKQYARQHGLQEFDYVLQPRTKGFTYFVNTLRNGAYQLNHITSHYVAKHE